MHGSDTVGTGSGTSGGAANSVCAFKTIAHALAKIGAPSTAVEIQLIGPGPASAAASGEIFPLDIPQNVTVVGVGTGANTATVQVGATVGFTLARHSSGLSNLIIDGSINMVPTGGHGVVVGTGSDSSTQVTGIEVRNFIDAGIRVSDGGYLIINAGTGTSVHNNGTTGAALSGLHVTGTGFASIVGGSSGVISFNSNGQDGILVDGYGSITLTGTPDATTVGKGTVVCNGNVLDGIQIHQNPNATKGTPSLNSITGLVAYKNTQDGLNLYGGANVKVRGSVLLANLNGVNVQSNTTAGVSVPDDTSNMDLGKVAASDPGDNTLQATTASNNANNGAGICMQIGSGKNQVINAVGNVFVDATQVVANCATTAATLTSSTGACAGGVALAGTITNGATSNGAHVQMCSCVLGCR